MHEFVARVSLFTIAVTAIELKTAPKPLMEWVNVLFPVRCSILTKTVEVCNCYTIATLYVRL